MKYDVVGVSRGKFVFAHAQNVNFTEAKRIRKELVMRNFEIATIESGTVLFKESGFAVNNS